MKLGGGNEGGCTAELSNLEGERSTHCKNKRKATKQAMSQSLEADTVTTEVGSPISISDEEVSSALVQDSDAKNGELHHSNDGLHQSLVDDDFSPLSGKPFYNCIVTQSNLHRLYHMVFPVMLHPELPTKTVPAVVTCRGKDWEMIFLGGSTKKRFEIQSWKRFAIENNLKLGDAMFWEVMESSDEKVNFKLQIIRGDLPTELAAQVNGETVYTPILID